MAVRLAPESESDGAFLKTGKTVAIERFLGGAGDRDRTGMASLEGWGSTIELHPRILAQSSQTPKLRCLEIASGRSCEATEPHPNGLGGLIRLSLLR